MMATDPTARFTARVADYVRHRPSYPAEIFDLIAREGGLRLGREVADVGSGTGISAKGLLRTGATVYAVEPNEAMRAAAEAALGSRDGFVSVDGTSEATGLADGALGAVTAFQAFHWFDRAAARREFARILNPGGLVALVWNDRDEASTPFLRGYEALLREFAGDYLAVRHNGIAEADLDAWFGGTMRAASFPNAQTFDLDGVLGRLLSSSYAPPAGDPRHAPMVEALRRLFDETAENDRVEMRYEARVFYGPLG